MISAAAQRTAEQLINELFDVIDNRRWDQLSRVFAEDGVYERPGYEPLVGLAAIQHFYRYERVVDQGRHDVEHVVSDLGTAACWGRFTGMDRSGRPLDEAFADAYAVTEGKIKHRVTYFYRPAI
ncbi:nuclear transport factor 2 family protein [Streptomyces sp. NPDC051105]|uniref:nuclear transport factor 2 family protein n=1 Tax=Streptomyces sp. NPDC051105 TaxID=3154843 RepID=UPI00344595D2